MYRQGIMPGEWDWMNRANGSGGMTPAQRWEAQQVAKRYQQLNQQPSMNPYQVASQTQTAMQGAQGAGAGSNMMGGLLGALPAIGGLLGGGQQQPQQQPMTVIQPKQNQMIDFENRRPIFQFMPGGGYGV